MSKLKDLFNVALAQAYDLKSSAQQLAEGSPIDSPEKIFLVLKRLVQYTYTTFFIVAVLFIIIAAFNFLNAKGDPTKINSAKSQIFWAIVAIIIALVSIAAAQIINNFIEGA